VKRSRINPVSKKRKALTSERNQTRMAVFSRSSRCEANVEPICSYHATDVHEIKTRARGGSITDVNNCLALCRNCHRFITDNPAWALEHGYVVHAWAGEAEMLAASRARRAWQFGVVGYLSNDESF
jgi:hypothetical protein